MSFLDSCAEDAFAITPDDAAELIVNAGALYIGITGNVAIVTTSGKQVTFIAVPAGILPVKAKKVLATGTTAGNIVGLTRGQIK